MLKKIFLIATILFFFGFNQTQAQNQLRIGVVSIPQDLGNPYGSITMPTILGSLGVFDSLTIIDEIGQTRPWISSSWKYLDPLTWHFIIKKNIKFSNGEKLDAYAAAEAINYFSSGNGLIEVVAQLVNNIQSAKAINSSLLEIKTKKPNILLPRRISAIRIPPPLYWKKLGRKEFSRKPIGSGSFISTKWDSNKIILVANKESWRPPKIDKIEIIAIPEITSRLQAIITGAIDIAIDISPDDKVSLEKSNSKLNYRPSGRIQLLTFLSTSNSPVSDVRVRQALNYAVNKERIIKLLLADSTQPTGQAAVKASFGFNPSIKPYPYSPKRAKELLSQSGYPNGFKMSADILQGATAGDGAWYLQIANDLKEIGINLNYNMASYAIHIRKIRQGGWKGTAFGMDFNNLPTLDVLWPLRVHSCLWKAPWHCNKEWDLLIEEAEEEFNINKRLYKTQKLVELYHKQPTGIYLWEIPGIDGVSNRVNNYKPHHAYVNLHELDLK